MSVFDKNIIKKDLPLEDILRDKITTRIEPIVYDINENTRRGVLDFPRATKPGTYGEFDDSRVWHDRYSALCDYVTVSLNMFQSELTESPLVHDEGKVYIDHIYIDHIKCNSAPYAVDVCTSNKITVVMQCHKVVKKDTFSWGRENYIYQFDFNISLEPPTNFQARYLGVPQFII